MRYKLRNQKGFTLIELLIVVAIIGVLAAIVLSSLGSAQEKTKIARAKTEVKQIMTAAQLVFHDYGYYPNDSHGTVTCPKDIIVDQGTGKTFGSYIDICNDPWGRPYEWNNQCAVGGLRNPHGTNPSCPWFSDSDPGPIGVFVLGPDGTYNTCSGDDLCMGSRGHTEYGFTGGTTPSQGGGGPMCLNTISDCSGLSNSVCTFRNGCSLSASGCTGTYVNSCAGFADQSSCTVNTGCSWSSSGCGGTPSSCTSYGDSSSCGGAPGCTWSSGCAGTVSCSTYSSDQTTCQASGCSYSTASCGGSYDCSTWNGTDSTTCTSGHPGCSWSAGPKKCNGGILSCSGFSQGSCTLPGCSWNSNTCSGSPSCSGFNTTQCTATTGCSTSSSCSGSASACATYGTSGSCSAAPGCSWGASSCQGTYSANCTEYADQTSCQAVPTCAWDSGACSGTAVSCTTFNDQNTCILQSGCDWQ